MSTAEVYGGTTESVCGDRALRDRLPATMILTSLRVGELCALRWHAVDLAAGKLTVEDSKTL